MNNSFETIFHIFRHINADILKKYMPMPSNPDDEKVLVMVCGPPGFMKLLSGDKNEDKTQVNKKESFYSMQITVN